MFHKNKFDTDGLLYGLLRYIRFILIITVAEGKN